jgi:hypothetical protein
MVRARLGAAIRISPIARPARSHPAGSRPPSDIVRWLEGDALAPHGRNDLLGWLVFNRAALVFWSLLFCLAAAEVGLRILGRVQGIDYRLYAENLLSPTQFPLGLSCHWKGYTYPSLCPNFAGVFSTPDYSVVYKTNSKGLRDREYPARKPAGKTRILAIGDSFTFGTGIAYGDRFTDLLENAFDDLEVISMAVPGSGHDQQLMQFVHEGIGYQPDHVFVFVTSATLDPMRSFRPLVREGRVELPAFDRFAPPRRAPSLEERIAKAAADWPLWRRSHALCFLAYKLFRAALQWRFQPPDARAFASGLPSGGSDALPFLADSQIERAVLVFRQLTEVAVANRISPTFVNLDVNFDASYLADLDARARYLDLAPRLREEAKRHRLGFEYDTHFNPESNAAIASELIEFVKGGFKPGAAYRPPSRHGSPRERAVAAQ